MSTLGTYSFLPWLRQGIANQIASADFDPAVKVRPRIDVNLELRGEKLEGGIATQALNRKVELFGPGDVVGVERRAIIRTEPRHWVTNFEPNYLAHIEFYDEDFPWRYTPAAPDLGKSRLRPWLTLLVLTEEEFRDGKNIQGKPLPYIEVPDLGVFPRADELWAWAHVHVNESLAASEAEFVSSDMAAVLPKLETTLGRDADLGYSRLVCPRKLAENTAYHAFLIPTFEVGRRAGLGLELGDVEATLSAWDPGTRPEGQNFPVYFRWYFRTGTSGDFESLVRLLKPRPVDPRVGTREMDVQYPGSNVRPLDKPELDGILKLGGALRPPSLVPPAPPDKYETWDKPFPRPLQEDLARLLNLPDDYQRVGDPDPIIAPPLYGRWHALTGRVLTEADGTPAAHSDNWLHRLNLDPRFRAAAGFGTRVIQDNQEKFMDAAWEQIGKVLEAQRRIRLGQFSLQTSLIWHERHLKPLVTKRTAQSMLLMSPLNRRLLTAGTTVHHTLGTANVQPAMTSPALRRLLRPRGRLAQSFSLSAPRALDELFDRVNRGEVSAAPPKVAPPGVVTADELADALLPAGVPPAVVAWIRRSRLAPFLLFLFALALAVALLVLLPSPWGFTLAMAVLGAGLWLYRRVKRWIERANAAEALRATNETPEAVDGMPAAPGFSVLKVGESYTAGVGTDSVEAGRLKTALREHFSGLVVSRAAGAVVPKQRLDLSALATTAWTQLAPATVVPRRILSGMTIPDRIKKDLPEGFVEPMAYPIIDLPMYEPLKDRSAELFLPNINLIEMNSITLLETNQRFIEAYMVGLNHEFARELLWREYPTDQRGSTFRQFWDVRSFFDTENLDDEALKEKLRDIPPLHEWSISSELGEHDHREADGENEDELVLVIRGELLKRYPNAVIYAHRACWQKTSTSPADLAKEPCLRGGNLDNTQERRLVPLSVAEEAKPPKFKVRTPLYEAKVDPDIYFFGFDLTVEAAKGESGEHPNDDPGWFFVIKERPGEPRFGLDGEQQPTLNVYNDLSWPDVQPDPPGSYIEIASAPAAFPLAAPGTQDQEKAEQHFEDKKVLWSRNMSSAELAYVLFQAPVLVAVHGSEMLPR
jgi:hypothetical protein